MVGYSAEWLVVKIELEKVLDKLFGSNVKAYHEFDSTLSFDEYEELGYGKNFPHLSCISCSVSESDLNSVSNGDVQLNNSFTSLDAKWALLPATCYKIYLLKRDSTIRENELFGVIARCYRNEDKALGSYRHSSFIMKEFVFLGSENGAKNHLLEGMKIMKEFLNSIELPFQVEVASDPFFDESSSISLSSKLFSTKKEVLYQDHAISSFNYHRNYFGNKFKIYKSDKMIHTSCIAFGVDRWITALTEHLRSPDEILRRLEAV